MEVDLEVLCTTINDYGQALETVTNIKDKIKNTNTTLADKGWTGKAQKKYNELLEWFLSKDYECLLENLKCVTTVLYNEAKYPGGGLKDRCEDFVNCLDLSEKGYYPEGSGASSGVLSLDYDNTNSIVINLYDIIEDLISQKRKVLKELESTIHGGWFSSGLIYCSFSIDNELDESFNQISKEEQGLNSLLVSFQQYVPNIRGLEEGVCSGLSKVKDLAHTAVSEHSLNNIDQSAKLGTVGKVKTAAKTVVVDVGVGAVTTVGGVCVIAIAYGVAVPTFFVSTATIPEGGAMIVSGANSTYNGAKDIVREINGEWGEVGSTNIFKDSLSNKLQEYHVGGEKADMIASTATTILDTTASVRGGYDGFKGSFNIGKDAINGGKTVLNTYKAFGLSYKVANMTSGEIKAVNVIKIDAEALKNAAPKIGTAAYNDVTTIFNIKTIWGDATPMFVNQDAKATYEINYWLENNTWND